MRLGTVYSTETIEQITYKLRLVHLVMTWRRYSGVEFSPVSNNVRFAVSLFSVNSDMKCALCSLVRQWEYNYPFGVKFVMNA
jgi:hypothetical protein